MTILSCLAEIAVNTRSEWPRGNCWPIVWNPAAEAETKNGPSGKCSKQNRPCPSLRVSWFKAAMRTLAAAMGLPCGSRIVPESVQSCARAVIAQRQMMKCSFNSEDTRAAAVWIYHGSKRSRFNRENTSKRSPRRSIPPLLVVSAGSSRGRISISICTAVPSLAGYNEKDPRAVAAAEISGAPVTWGHPPIEPGRTISSAFDRGIPSESEGLRLPQPREIAPPCPPPVPRIVFGKLLGEFTFF